MTDQWTPFKVWRAITWYKLKLRFKRKPTRKGEWTPVGYTTDGGTAFMAPVGTTAPDGFKIVGGGSPRHMLPMTDNIEVTNLPQTPDPGDLMFPHGGPRSKYVQGFHVSREGIEALLGRKVVPSDEFKHQAAQFMQEHDELLRRLGDDPAPPEHPAAERWADLRRKAHPDAGE